MTLLYINTFGVPQVVEDAPVLLKTAGPSRAGKKTRFFKEKVFRFLVFLVFKKVFKGFNVQRPDTKL